MIIVCKYCKNEKYVFPSRIKHNRGATFCNKICKSKFNNVEIICKICNKTKIIPRSWTKGRGGKFCSKSCHYKYKRLFCRGENHPWYGRKHSMASRKKMSQSLKGKPSWCKGKKLHYPAWNKGTKGVVRGWNTGKKWSSTVIKKLKIAQKKRFSNPLNHPLYGKHHKEETKQKIRERAQQRFVDPKNHPMYGKHHSIETRKKMSGEKHPNWKGGRTDLRQKIRLSKYYKFWRKKVFGRDNYVCQLCNQRGGDLEADHIKPFAKILSDFNIKTIDDAYQCTELWDISNGRVLCVDCHKIITFKHEAKKD